MAVIDDELIFGARDSLRRLAHPFLLRAYDATPDEYEAIDNEDFKCEFLDGVLIVHSPATFEHEDVAGFVLMWLRDFVSNRRLGWVLGSNAVMQLGDKRFSPDVSFLGVLNKDRVSAGRVIGPMDLVVEVLSSSTRTYDRGEKLAAYRDGGVPEIWLIDPDEQVFQAHVLRDNRYDVTVLATGRYAAASVNGLALTVDWLWRRPLPGLLECQTAS